MNIRIHVKNTTGRRSRPAGVTFERGFDGASRREPALRRLAPRSSVRSADERGLVGVPTLEIVSHVEAGETLEPAQEQVS